MQGIQYFKERNDVDIVNVLNIIMTLNFEEKVFITILKYTLFKLNMYGLDWHLTNVS